MIGQVVKLLALSFLHFFDLACQTLLLIRLYDSNDAIFVPFVAVVVVTVIANFIHVFRDAKMHRSLLSILPGGVPLWLSLSLLSPMLISSKPFFLLRVVVGLVGRDFKSSLVVVSEDAADAAFCLHAYLLAAPAAALNLFGAAANNGASLLRAAAFGASLLHVFLGVFSGRASNQQLYLAWFFSDGAAAGLRLFAALVSVLLRFWCVLVGVTTLGTAALFASHRGALYLALGALAAPHLLFLVVQVAWHLFAHRALTFVKQRRRRIAVTVASASLSVATALTNAFLVSVWFVETETSASHRRRLLRPLLPPRPIAGIPDFVWPETGPWIRDAALNATQIIPVPSWSVCNESALFDGSASSPSRWRSFNNFSSDFADLWRSDTCFCLSDISRQLFLILFYANAIQVALCLALMVVCLAWRLIVSKLGEKEVKNPENGVVKGEQQF